MKMLALLSSRTNPSTNPSGPPNSVSFAPTRVPSVAALLAALRDDSWDATVVSLGAEHVDGPLIERVASLATAGTILLSTPRPSLDAALLAERIGAPPVLTEPLDGSAVRSLLDSVRDVGPVVPVPDGDTAAAGLVGQSPGMAPVFDLIARVARSSSTVLITGESGTGKEVVAKTLHQQSDRRDAPFVAINCAAIPEQLLESELFGHEKGAFTGAVARRVGRFEQAHGGTLFLDEIGDVSLLLQARVLRVLEERRVQPVGGKGGRDVDVRLIAATNQRLDEAIEEGRFRDDLYYRLAVVEMVLPPLRERPGDVRLLALHFAALFSHRHGRHIRGISEEALAALETSRWPGNVRELRNVIDRAVLLARNGVIDLGALRYGDASPHSAATTEPGGEHGYPVTASLRSVEADHIARVLASVDGQVGRAASILGVHRNTLSRKISEYEIGSTGAGAIG